jgi:uncharacterized membrane protein
MEISKRLRRYFLRGLAVLLPTILTIWVFVWGYKLIQQNIGKYINIWLVNLILFFQGENGMTRQALEKIWVDGAGSIAGFLVALIAVFFVGVMLASVVGKALWAMVEKSIMNTPFLKQVYPYIKQVTDFIFTPEDEKKSMFSRVVAVEYPRKGIWTIGLVTGPGPEKVNRKTDKDLVSILIPTSPTPFTGFVIMVPKEDTIDMDINIEEALRFTISAGVITPSKIEQKKIENNAP